MATHPSRRVPTGRELLLRELQESAPVRHREARSGRGLGSPKPSRIDELLERIRALENELEIELDRARRRWRYRIDAGRVRFAREVRQAHARVRQSIPRFLRESSLPNLLTAPIIYLMIVPIALLDLWITVFQTICFPIYGIARVRRSKYIVIDRQQLAYLNAIEKANCVYCGYANGVFAYVREIAGRTEQYWCPIRHARRVRAPHPHYRHFVDYGDATGYHRRLMPLRKELRERHRGGSSGSHRSSAGPCPRGKSRRPAHRAGAHVERRAT